MNKARIPRIAIVHAGTETGVLLGNAVYSMLNALGRFARVYPLADFPRDAERAELCISTSLQAGLKIRKQASMPILVYDTDLFSRKDGQGWKKLGLRSTGRLRSTFSLGEREFHLLREVPDLEMQEGNVESRVPDTLLYCLPVFLCREFRQASCFYTLCSMLERQIAELLKEERFLYVSPWPKGRDAAVAITLDSDGASRGEPSATLGEISKQGWPVTYFSCADHLERDTAWPANVEVACHGDTHDLFEGSDASRRRIRRMLESFRALGIEPLGFSPPSLFFGQGLGHLMESFEYVRIGHMERRMLFFPRRRAQESESFLVPLSGYTDYLIPEVGKEAYGAWIRRYLQWGVTRKQLLVFCFHPFLFGTDAFKAFTGLSQNIWIAPLGEIVAWWRKREQWMERVSREGAKQQPDEQDLTGGQEMEAVGRTWDENLAVRFPLVQRDEEVAPKKIEVVKGLYGRTVVDNLGGGARKDVEIDLQAVSAQGKVEPRLLRQRIWGGRVIPYNPAGFNGLLSGLDPDNTLLSRTGPGRIRIAHLFEDEVFGLCFESPSRRLRKGLRDLLRGRSVNMGDHI